MLEISEISFGSNLPELKGPGPATESPTSAIGLVLAGPHPLTLYGLSHMFEKERDCNVLAACSGADAILDAIRRHQPDLLVLDLERNGGLALLRRIQRQYPSTRVVVLAAASDNKHMIDALRLGARAVVPKELPPETLVAYIRKVHHGGQPAEMRGEHSFETREVRQIVGRLVKASTPIRHIARHLTPREAEIARLAVRGISAKDIATQLGLKQGTVKIHLHSIYEKLNVEGRVGLVLVGRRHGLA